MKITEDEEKRYLELQLLALDFAREGNTQELAKMIDYGLSVNLSTTKDDSLLMLSSYNGNLETTEMLIQKGANLDQVNQRGQTPLEGVCFKGDLCLVKLLVENGADYKGKAIIYASIFGQKEIVEYLQKKSNSQKSFTLIILNTITLVSSKIKNIFGYFK